MRSESVSSILQRKILEIMADGKERSVAEIKEALKNQKSLIYKKDFTEGHLSGSLLVMKKSGKLHQRTRGTYWFCGNPQAEASEGKNTANSEDREGSRGSDASAGSAKEYRMKEEFGNLKKEILDCFQKEYERLVRCLNASSVGTLNMEEFKKAGELLELKNDLGEILKKNQTFKESTERNQKESCNSGITEK